MLDDLAEAFQSAVGWFISSTASWWVKTPSPDLANDPVVGTMQRLIQPLTIAVAVTALLVVGAKMALMRRANPLVEATGGLVVLVTVTTIGVLVPHHLLQWVDIWADWALTAAAQGDFAKRMSRIVLLPSGAPAGVVVIMSIAALFVGIIQAILLLFRQAALIILAGMLPLAAAGMLTTATRPWFKKVTGWGLALIFYKAAAAAVYAAAFLLIGDNKNLQAVLMGFAMLVISLIAFPVLLKFFTWATGTAESSSGGGILTAVMGGATALGALRAFPGGGAGFAGGAGGTSPASDHAAFLRQQLGDAPGSGTHPSHQAGQPTPTGLPGDHRPGAPGADGPSGSEAPPPDGHGTGVAGAAPDGDHAEPVGPTATHIWNKERRRGRDTIRWLNNPTGSDDLGGPTGADAGGGGGGGA